MYEVTKLATMKHIETVRNYMDIIVIELLKLYNPIMIDKVNNFDDMSDKNLIDMLMISICDLKKCPITTKHVTEHYLRHNHNIPDKITFVITELLHKAERHDQSKLYNPEAKIFDIYTPKLKNTTYGSDEYKTYLKEMQVALDHHYNNNPHHPEYYTKGIEGMSILDLIEMLLDWKAATLRHDDGDIFKSIEINQKRFNYDDTMKQLFINTIFFIDEKNNHLIYEKSGFKN